jgi:CRISPR-associated protein Csx10
MFDRKLLLMQGGKVVVRYIKYRITAMEAIKIGNNQTRQNYDHETLRYISGSALRGAFIAKYISKYGESGLANMLNLRFTNAYIVAGEKRAVPVAANLFANKDDREKTEYTVFNIFDRQPSGRDLGIGGGFGIFDGGKIIGIPVETGQNLHITTWNVQDENTRNLFQYEYINQGQQFDGFVIVDDFELFDLVMDILTKINNVWYIGSSKGSGYGQCRISDVSEQNSEFEFSVQYPQGYFYLLFLSDAIIRDEDGKLTTEIPVDLIRKYTGLENIEKIVQAVRLVNIGGYNQKMKSTLQQYSSIGAGSIFKYKCSGTVRPEFLKQWIDQGIGERRQDGYGRFTIFADFNFNYYKKDCPDHATETAVCHSDEGLAIILQRIFENKLQTAFEANMLILTANFLSPKNQFKAKIGNLIMLLRSIYYLPPDHGRRQTEDFRRKIAKKVKGNPKVFGFYTLAKINGVNPLDFILQCVDTSDSGFVKQKCAVISAQSGLKCTMDEADIYHRGINFAIAVFKRILAGEENNHECEI